MNKEVRFNAEMNNHPDLERKYNCCIWRKKTIQFYHVDSSTIVQQEAVTWRKVEWTDLQNVSQSNQIDNGALNKDYFNR